MFRTQPTGRQASNNVSSASSSRTTSNENSPTTIREIRSRTSSTSTARSQLLANRRQAMSMEKLNSSSSSSSSPTSAMSGSTTQSNNDNKQKGSPLSGSQSRLNGSTSPSRGVGLNRTASRVSRFRSAKAVFERLSSANSNSNKIYDKPSSTISIRPKGTVASRYAAAAAARAIAASQLNNSTNVNNTSPKTKTMSSLARSTQDSSKSSSNIEINRLNPTTTTRNEPSQPKPQPRVVTGRVSSSNSGDNRSQASVVAPKNPAQNVAKPPPKDLIDEIVLEIAQEPDANCTIQDLSNCDISGIPETLNFDRCFQDVEMMTEEEARKLLSRKSDSMNAASTNGPTSATRQISSISDISPSTIVPEDDMLVSCEGTDLRKATENNDKELALSELDLDSDVDLLKKSKVRFSDEPAQIFNTHAVEDYDRRNDDIDPVAASAEYEIEKSKERECGGADSDDEDNSSQTDQSSNRYNECVATKQNLSQNETNTDHPAEQQNKDSEYIESLEREVGFKRILEQNLRDLQSQYYAAVKELDDYKSSADNQLSELQENICDAKSKLEASQNDLSDAREQSSQFERQLNDIKESSQILEKKYHRAKKIIKDMQSREQSFNRREQLYQQKLDEIEHELGVLIESIDRTIYEDGVKYFSVTESSSCQRQHRHKLDAFGLIRQILKDFNDDQSTHYPQIKQRVISILEQKLAELMATANGNVQASHHQMKTSTSIDEPQLKFAQLDEQNRHGQNTNYQLASHRLSQPNLPHPIGVGGQPTKLFHNIPPPASVALNESSPPHSVNSYPSTNSLNSLNNNNNHLSSNNNNLTQNKCSNDQPPSGSDFHLNMHSIILPSSTTATGCGDSNEVKFQPVHDIQVPYQTNEWHDKPVSEWTTTQVSTWLLALGLDQYISKFEDRNVNGQSLINLDSTVLKGLGVLNSNDRNLLKKKIRELRTEMEKERKLIEKKMKENLKDKSKGKFNNNNKTDNVNSDINQSKPSWKRGLLS